MRAVKRLWEKLEQGGVAVKSDAYPMHCAKRCDAKSKRTGLPCGSPAVRGWNVCRMHGARGGAQPGSAHPNFQHGERSEKATALRRYINALGRDARQLDDSL